MFLNLHTVFRNQRNINVNQIAFLSTVNYCSQYITKHYFTKYSLETLFEKLGLCVSKD